MKQAAVAPAGLRPPAFVAGRLGDRQERIFCHGFSEQDIKPEWWNKRLAGVGLGEFRVSVDPNRTGEVRLTRGDLFRLAKTLDRDADDGAYLNLLWHVLAWGSGTSRRNNRKRVEAFRDSVIRRENVQLLRRATTYARDAGSAEDAYACLIARGGGRIAYLGPAFFTKFLYFVGQGAPGHQCLILDARVARSLYDAGWKSLPRTARGASWTYSHNWFTATYTSYVQLLGRWADEQSAQPVAPDQIERALFDGS